MPESEITEQQAEQTLIKQASHNQVAFQVLYHQYFARVYAYVAAKIQDKRDAEDLVSDIFLQAMRGIATFRNRHDLSFAAWIFTIARNAVTDQYRRLAHNAGEIELDVAALDEVDSPALDQLFIRQENAAEIRDLLDTLPERRRDVLMLRYFSGLRNLEIAQVLEIDERTVASHISLGLRDLHAAYIRNAEESVGHGQ